MKVGKIKGIPIATSQQVRGEHALNEGPGEPNVPAVQWGTNYAPTGLPTKATLKKPFHTTAQIKGELSTPES